MKSRVIFTIVALVAFVDTVYAIQIFNIEEPASFVKPWTQTKKRPSVEVSGDCSFRVNGNLTEPQPLFALPGQYKFLNPNPDGVVEIANGNYIDMYCNKSFAAPFENDTRLTAQCLQGLYFLVEGVIHPFRDFSCTKWPLYTTRTSNRTCNGGGNYLVEVGFEVLGGFLQIMDVCHDTVKEVTRYVHHRLNPSSVAYQKYIQRPFFIEGGFYAGKKLDKIYSKIQQKATFDVILGEDTAKYFNDSIHTYLARGHLSARADHIFGAQQRGTFFFINAAPQWHIFNKGNWVLVEDAVRRYVANNSLFVDCYTGVWGVSTLPDVNGTHRELYLAFDENNNGLIPVPKIFFRVVIEPSSKRGIALIGVNNPHATLAEILSEYVICDDISEQINWIRWKKKNIISGYSYACEVNQFRNVVTGLPDFEVNALLV